MDIYVQRQNVVVRPLLHGSMDVIHAGRILVYFYVLFTS